MAVTGICQCYMVSHSMARIVTNTYRYKRPPKKRKAVPLGMPAVVTAGIRRRTPQPRPAEEPEPVAPPPANDDAPTEPPPPAAKSAIVTSKRSKRIALTAGDAGEASPSVKAFFARMIRPRGE